jgi:hypothetical protein
MLESDEDELAAASRAYAALTTARSDPRRRL